MNPTEEPQEISPEIYLEIDIDIGGSLIEVAALTIEEGTTIIMMIGIGRPAMVRADTERVARSP